MSDDNLPPSEHLLSTEELNEKSPKELDALLHKVKNQMSECVLQSSWKYTVPAVSLSVPISVLMKSYSPLVFCAVTASGYDFILGMRKCDHFNQNIQEIKKVIALHQLGGKTFKPFIFRKQ